MTSVADLTIGKMSTRVLQAKGILVHIWSQRMIMALANFRYAWGANGIDQDI